MLSFLGREMTARLLVERLLAIDPLTPLHHFLPGWLDYVDGRLEEGLERCQSACKKDPYGVCAWVCTILLLGTRRLKEAGSMIELLEQKLIASPYIQSVLFVKYAMSANKKEALDAVTPELVANARRNEVLPWLMASGYAFLDDKEEAFHWLEHAISRGFINYQFLSRYDPFMQNLRGEERFHKLMERVKYEWEHFEI
jgi:predicted Zn-dependent protease